MRSADVDWTPWLLGGALALGLAVQVLLPAAPLTMVAMHPMRSASMQTIAPLPVVPAYAAIADRPLFSPSRSASEAVAEDVAPAGAFALLGVASGAGGASAVIRAGSSQASEVVRLGGTLLGWRVTAVGGDMAVVSRNGASQTLRVGAPAATTTATPAAAEARGQQQ